MRAKSGLLFGLCLGLAVACGGEGGAGADPEDAAAGNSGDAGTGDAGPDTGGAEPTPPPELSWVRLNGRSFTMGSADGLPEERPEHTVEVADFEITTTEVTVAEYTACVKAGACSHAAHFPGCNYKVPGREKHPINCVDWDQAHAFADWIGGGARLPTEAEWEFAARSGGRDREFPWGDTPATCELAVMNEGIPGCGDDHTAPVCSKPAGNTDQGACDLAGNVWEWVEDWYHDDYAGAPRDGSAWLDPPSSHRALRGGGWAYFAENLRTRHRGVVIAEGRDANVGFRLAR